MNGDDDIAELIVSPLVAAIALFVSLFYLLVTLTFSPYLHATFIDLRLFTLSPYCTKFSPSSPSQKRRI